MKLRNKETGKVQTCDMVVITDEKIDGEIASLNKHTFIFRSIEQFNDEYEAYKPAEPLIKDEKIRKAVRAWWNIQENPFVNAGILCKSYSGVPGNKDHDGYYNYCLYGYVEGHNHNLTATDFEFRTKTYIEYERHRDYTLAELCGEEEE